MDHNEKEARSKRSLLCVVSFHVLRSIAVVSFFLGAAAAILGRDVWPFSTWSAWTILALFIVIPYTAITLCDVIATRSNRA